MVAGPNLGPFLQQLKGLAGVLLLRPLQPLLVVDRVEPCLPWYIHTCGEDVRSGGGDATQQHVCVNRYPRAQESTSGRTTQHAARQGKHGRTSDCSME